MVVNQKETCAHSSISDISVCFCGKAAMECDICEKCLCECHPENDAFNAEIKAMLASTE